MPAVFYNDNDAKAAAWLRELQSASLIGKGEVDEHSILDLYGLDLSGFERVHLFAGIGGWEYALSLAGWDRAGGGPVWTGSCPCQPFSIASANAKGVHDERHLWPEMRRLISFCRPPVIFGEQVASAPGRLWFDGVRTDLEALGYRVGAADMCAAGIGAPHIRQRLYWVADRISDSLCPRQPQSDRPRQLDRAEGGETGTDSRVGRRGGDAFGLGEERHPGRGGDVDGGLCHTDAPGRRGLRVSRPSGAEGALRGDADGYGSPDGSWWPAQVRRWADGTTRRIEPGTLPLAHGVPGRVGLLRGYGNAIVPQLAALFIRAWMESIGLAPVTLDL